ncbi:PKD domain protein [uncultured archaeon]|nr:PKD domain protein [uncultured archaeon]
MRKGVILCLVFLLSINFVFAYDLNVTNVSLKTNYAPGEIISGSFNMNISNAPVNLYFSSSLGTLGIRDFLKANNQPLSCESINCSDVIVLANGGQTSKTISLISGDEKKYAFAVTDSGVSFNQLSLNLSSNFPESSNLPLQIVVGNGMVLNYNQFSENYNRQVSYGCYDTSLSSYEENSKIDQTGYCEKMSLNRSNKYLVGAQISGSALRDLKVQLKDSQGLQVLGECTISKDGSASTSFSDNSSCIIQTPSVNTEGNYYVCIKDVTAGSTDSSLFYKIRSETSGTNCGYYSNLATSSIDYAIYAKLPTYDAAPSSGFSFFANSSNSGLSGISSYVSQNYPSGCANTCLIPFSVTGVSQSLTFNNLDLAYSSVTGPRSTNKIYETDYSTRKFNFSGDVSLDALNWTLSGFGNKSFTLSLLGDGTKQILNSTFYVSLLPVIDYVSPLNPPAGIPVFFYVYVRNSGNISHYEWNFGDGSTVQITNVSYVLHNYQNLSNYTLSVKAGEGNYSDSGSFVINSVNPRDQLNQTFVAKRIRLNHANNDLLSLPSWYQNAVSRNVNLDYYQTELNNLESESRLATTDQDFLNVALKLYNLVMPWAIVITDKKVGPMVDNYNSFSPSIIQDIFPSSVGDDLLAYRSAMFEWQLENTNSTITRSLVRVFDENEIPRDVLSVYEINIKSNSNDESYFVIQKDFTTISFSSDTAVVPKKIGGNTYITVPAQDSISLKFYLNSTDYPVMFISPKLSLLSLNNSVGVCNFNLKCEANLGENSSNCRSDCRPIGWMWFWLVILLLVALVIYTILQEWYKRKYEEYLFTDRNELYNLLAFFSNGKLNKLSVPQMKVMLSQKGWDGEQIQYALLKSEGKNTGMFEIIPVDKIVSLFSKKPAQVPMQKPIAPVNPYPTRPGMQRPAFNPLKSQRRNIPVQNKTTTQFGQQSRPKY